MDKVIGSYEDKQGSSIIYFVYSSVNRHRIIRFFPQTNKVRLLIEWEGLNFHPGKRVNGIGLVDDLLYWTDRYNEPRKLNIAKAERTVYNLEGDKYPQPWQQDYIARVKRPAAFPLSCSFVSPADISAEPTGNPYQDGVQFACQYIYDDNEVSALSPYTKIIFMHTGYGEETGITFTGDPFSPATFPYITRVKVSTDITYAQAAERLIKAVRFIFREGNNGVPLVFKEQRIAQGTAADTISADFTSTLTGSGLSESESVRIFDSSPLLSGALAIAQNRIFEGDYILGYDAPAGISLTTLIETAAAASYQKGFKSRGRYKAGVAYYDKANRKSSVVAETEITIPDRYGIETTLPELNTTTDSILQTVSAGNESNIRHLVKWEISGEAPAWATHYQVLVSKCINIPYFFQTTCRYMFYYNREKDENNTENLFYSFVTTKSVKGVVLILNSTEGYQWQKGDRLRVITHFPLCDIDDNSVVAATGSTANSSALKDFEITEQRGNRLLIELEDISQWYWNLANGAAQKFVYGNVQVEIYRTAQEVSEEIYYEVGEAFPIVNGNHSVTEGYLPGDVFIQEQEIKFSRIRNVKIDTDPEDAGETLDDVVIRTSVTRAYFERQHPSEKFFTRWNTSIGHPNVTITEGGQAERRAGIRFSNKYLSGTLINGLSTFEALNERDLPLEHGEISKLILAGNSQQEGSVLLAIQRNETMSLYLNEAQFKDIAGRALVAISEQVIGSANTLRNGLGTIHPESVQQNNGRVYFYDALEGEVVRYGGDGLTPLAKTFRMKNHFFNQSQLHLQEGMEVEAIGGFDQYNNEYLLTFKEKQDQFTPTTIGFCDTETRRRFTSRYDFIPECYGRLNNMCVMFKEGRLWIHEADPEKCNNFFGEQYTSRFTFVCNEVPNIDRIWNAIAIHASDLWLPIKIENDQKQVSKMFPAYFDKHESVWYGSFRRDMKTLSEPVTSFEMRNLLGGEELRSQILIVTLENKSTSPVALYEVNVGYTVSSGHTI